MFNWSTFFGTLIVFGIILTVICGAALTVVYLGSIFGMYTPFILFGMIAFGFAVSGGFAESKPKNRKKRRKS